MQSGARGQQGGGRGGHGPKMVASASASPSSSSSAVSAPYLAFDQQQQQQQQRQDLSSGKTIGSAKECEGFYYFDEAKVSKRRQFASCDSAFIPKDSELLLWHYRIGHPSFQYLRHVFPSPFSNKISSDLFLRKL
ncbi:uncharacterized protein LOC111410334 isoform X1 [Olea europaea var. sylvestris]|uniref:uncharacterized protein LOC111410334 isoform X1 n=1 Tax=Olea europaea var. sylvestris TaxID=158386 RepID=UPI000C1D271F|nr:uncharacterized protein LOC111410334 isoform X1 [Olea europaea var. sylvestris]